MSARATTTGAGFVTALCVAAGLAGWVITIRPGSVPAAPPGEPPPVRPKAAAGTPAPDNPAPDAPRRPKADAPPSDSPRRPKADGPARPFARPDAKPDAKPAVPVGPAPVGIVEGVERQPLAAQARRIADALKLLGEPLSDADSAALADATDMMADAKAAVRRIQEILDRRTIAVVDINPESRVKVAPGAAEPELVENGWRVFLVKVHNQAGVTAELKADSPQAEPLSRRSTGSPEPKRTISPAQAADRFLELAMFNGQPLTPRLSGLEVEYRVVQLYSRDAGRREAVLRFNVGQGSQDLGFRNELPVHFLCRPSTAVVLRVADVDGSPTTAAFLITDARGRVHPAQTRRAAPDFGFHPQVYRADGESISLPAGTYDVEVTRGPEYLPLRTQLTVSAADRSQTAAFKLKRWIDPAAAGWWSGDHHIHAAGCAHYESPAEGVLPEHMMRHIVGEDLKVGCCLTWGPCWYFQKQFFEGRPHALSTEKHILRYDVEVSGFPSSHCGHLMLLKMGKQDFPGAKRLEQWPSWTQPILEWGKQQGAVVGYTHSGWGLDLGDTRELPSYRVPPFNGIGANEYIVTVANGACDVISLVDTPAIWELNIWYHTLNVGFRCRASGETDFPCIYGERVGLGRSYVKLDGKLDFDKWALGLRDGRAYASDGRSHLLDFRVDDVRMGEAGSERKLKAPGMVKVRVKAAALLAEKVTPATEAIRSRPWHQKPYWDIERARLGDTRTVPVEVIVNGVPAAKAELTADGTLRDLEFDVAVKHSSWIAVRVLPSSHTNPIFVEVDGLPVRASRRSAQWCIDAVDKCWESKSPRIAPAEREAAKAAYDKARAIYQARLVASVAE